MHRPLTTALACVAMAFTVAAAPPAANRFNDQLRRLDPLQQRVALRRAIMDSGEWCGRIASGRFQGPHGNLMMWVARCVQDADTRRFYDYGVFIGTDASVQVRRCDQMRELKLPACGRL